jgi:predicted  nucleic acid-binding Zn-ribbon protein
MLKSAENQQESTQRKLDESLRREQRLNDQNNDLQTDLKAQNELLQIVKESLPSPLRKKADAIPKHWKREIRETLNMKTGASAQH